MRAALRDAGWSNYSLFLSDDGLLVGYLETDNYQAALDAMAATDVNTRWQAEMSEYFMNTTAVAEAAGAGGAGAGGAGAVGAGAGGDTDSGPPDRSFLRIAEIFHLD
jgi:L-rhamnose mutarotase